MLIDSVHVLCAADHSATWKRKIGVNAQLSPDFVLNVENANDAWPSSVSVMPSLML